MLVKQKNPSLLRNLVLGTFGGSLTVFSTKLNLLYLFNGSEVLSSASDKAKLFAKNFSKNSTLDDILSLDSSKASGPDYIPVVVLKNCEPELSYILAELFNICLKVSCFADY